MAIPILAKVADGAIWRVRRSIKSRYFIEDWIGVRMALGTSRDPPSTMITRIVTRS